MADDFQISTLDMQAVNPALRVTEGLAYDAPYLYVTPHNYFVIAKIDARTFKIVDTLDLSKFDPTLTAMLGSFIADGFLYILPHLSNSGPTYQSHVVRVDLKNFTPAGCSLLKVFDATKELNALNGLTDGVHGYLNMHVYAEVMVTRFGLGADFKPGSIATVAIPTIDGFPVQQGNLIAVDKTAAYVLTLVTTKAGTGKGDQESELYLVTIPTANFTAKAATFQRLTNVRYLRGAIPTVVDDGKNLWCPPIPILRGPMEGKSVGLIKIPKANPAAVTIHEPPATARAQPSPRAWNAGMGVYDGWRYGYIPSDNSPKILQIDTHNPGTINTIDISAFAGAYAMFGLGYDGHWIYAISYNGGAGLCLRFLPPKSPVAGCPCCTESLA